MNQDQARRAYKKFGKAVGLFILAEIAATGLRALPRETLSGVSLVFVLTLIFLVLVVFIASAIIFAGACCTYARAKGYHPAIGIMGLIPFVGLIALCVLPDHARGSIPEGFAVLLPKVTVHGDDGANQ